MYTRITKKQLINDFLPASCAVPWSDVLAGTYQCHPRSTRNMDGHFTQGMWGVAGMRSAGWSIVLYDGGREEKCCDL